MKDLQKIEELIRKFSGALQLKRLYPSGHQRIIEEIENLFKIIREILKEKNQITLGIIGKEFIYDKYLLYKISENFQSLIDELKKSSIEKIVFLSTITKEELSEFLDILISEELLKKPNIQNLIKERQIKGILVGKISEEVEKKEKDLLSLAKDTYQDGLKILEKIFKDSTFESLILDPTLIRSLISRLIDILLENKVLLLILSNIKTHDEYTFVHSLNVSVLTLIQGEALGLDRDSLTQLGTAGLLHDVGKLAISKKILQKPVSLTDEEKEEVKSHPVIGAKLLLENKELNKLCSIAAFQHHLKYDLSGYPEIHREKRLNLVSNLVSISDYYDALRSKRSYHEDFSPEKIYREMLDLKGEYFSPDLLENFFSTIGVYPPGSLVELEDGSIGLVIETNRSDLERPVVEILFDKNKNELSPTKKINLLEAKQRIVKSINPIGEEGKKFIPSRYL